MQVCLPAGCIDAIRVSLVDECTDLVVCGPAAGYVFNCFRGLEITTNIEEGNETVLRSDCGKKCWQTRKPDELTNMGLAFELLNPDYELTNLLTGQPLINDGIENIGWYQKEGVTHSPWMCVELFEQVPDESCSAGHRYRRIIIPKIRFKLPENTREDPFRILPFSGVSASRSIASYGDGPYHDSPFDFGVLDPSIETHYIEFFDDIITDTLEGVCGYLPVICYNGFAVQWIAQDQLSVSDNTGATTFCEADDIVVTFSDGSTVTIPNGDPNLTYSADCSGVVITGWGVYNPDNLVITGITTVLNGDETGKYDPNYGLPAGQYAPVPTSPGFWEALFPGLDSGGEMIPWGGDAGMGCYYLSFWYSCATDVLSVAFNKKDLYGGDVFRTEIDTDTGTYTVPVVNEWRTPANAWTYGSGMQIQNASQYGNHWLKIRAYDAADTLICEWTEPGQTWNGGPWTLDDGRCAAPTPVPGSPIINNVVVN